MSRTEAYGVARTLQALELLADAPRTTTQIATSLLIHERTARRLLNRLVDEGYVRRTLKPRPRYSLTARFGKLAARAADQVSERRPGALETIDSVQPLTEPSPTRDALLRRALNALQLAWMHEFARLMSALAVGPTELLALLHLHQDGDHDASSLGASLGLSAGGTRALWLHLGDRELVQLRADPNDRQRRTATLTSGGREQLHATAQNPCRQGAIWHSGSKPGE